MFTSLSLNPFATFILLVCTLYITQDAIRDWISLLKGSSNDTIHELYEKSQVKSKKASTSSKVTSCLLLPFQVFGEYVFFFIIAPIWAIVGIQNDLKAYGWLVLTASILTGVISLYRFINSTKDMVKYAMNMELVKDQSKTSPDPATIVIVQNANKEISSVDGRQYAMTGGPVLATVYTLLATFVNSFMIVLLIKAFI